MGRMVKGLLVFGGLLGLGYVVFLAVLFAGQDRLLFYPTKQLLGTPGHRGLAYTNVHLTTADGEQLHGWWVPAPPAEVPRGTLLFLHGNAGNISGRLELLRRFHDLGLNVFIFDYRGYGASTGEPSEAGLYHDADAAWAYLTETQGVPPQRIVLFGRSLGGGVAGYLAARHAVAGVILEATFTSVPALTADRYPYVPGRLLARSRFDTEARLAAIEAPVLILHSPADEIIPFGHARRLYEAAAGPKSLVELQGGHNDAFLTSGSAYSEALDAFLHEVF